MPEKITGAMLEKKKVKKKKNGAKPQSERHNPLGNNGGTSWSSTPPRPRTRNQKKAKLRREFWGENDAVRQFDVGEPKKSEQGEDTQKRRERFEITVGRFSGEGEEKEAEGNPLRDVKKLPDLSGDAGLEDRLREDDLVPYTGLDG